MKLKRYTTHVKWYIRRETHPKPSTIVITKLANAQSSPPMSDRDARLLQSLRQHLQQIDKIAAHRAAILASTSSVLVGLPTRSSGAVPSSSAIIAPPPPASRLPPIPTTGVDAATTALLLPPELPVVAVSAAPPPAQSVVRPHVAMAAITPHAAVQTATPLPLSAPLLPPPAAGGPPAHLPLHAPSAPATSHVADVVGTSSTAAVVRHANASFSTITVSAGSTSTAPATVTNAAAATATASTSPDSVRSDDQFMALLESPSTTATVRSPPAVAASVSGAKRPRTAPADDNGAMAHKRQRLNGPPDSHLQLPAIQHSST